MSHFFRFHLNRRLPELSTICMVNPLRSSRLRQPPTIAIERAAEICRERDDRQETASSPTQRGSTGGMSRASRVQRAGKHAWSCFAGIAEEYDRRTLSLGSRGGF